MLVSEFARVKKKHFYSFEVHSIFKTVNVSKYVKPKQLLFFRSIFDLTNSFQKNKYKGKFYYITHIYISYLDIKNE